MGCCQARVTDGAEMMRLGPINMQWGNFQKPPNHGLHRGEATNRFVELSLAEKVVFTYFLYESLIGSNFIILTEDIHNSS